MRGRVEKLEPNTEKKKKKFKEMGLGLCVKFENEELSENTNMLIIISAPRSNRDTHLL